MNLTITTVKETIRLLKRANHTDYATLAETAKELKISKTALMSFVETFEPLFWLQYLVTNNPKAKDPGLLIKEIYEKAEDNPIRSEFLKALKEKWKNTIHVSAYYEYSELRGYYIDEDRLSGHQKEDNRLNFHLWRNTAEKMQRIVASGHCRPDFYWGGGDGRSKIHFDHCVTDEDLKALEAEGWTIEGAPKVHR